MAHTINIDVVDMTIPDLNNRNIPIINQPNPCYGYAANAKEVRRLIQLSNYKITEAGTNKPITGNNYYEYFPEEQPGGGGGGEVTPQIVQSMINASIDSTVSETSTKAVQNAAITNFVNSSIESSTAEFKGTYDSKAEMDEVTANQNDYAFLRVLNNDGSVNHYERYKWSNTEVSGSHWLFEYNVNNSSFTAEQWAAINSGIKDTDVSALGGHVNNTNNPHNVTKAQVGLSDVDNTSDADKPISTATQTALNTKFDTAGTGLNKNGTTVSHATPEGAATHVKAFYKFSTDALGHVNGVTEATEAETDAIDSGITAEKVAQIETNKNNILSIRNTYCNEYENVSLTFVGTTGYYEKTPPYSYITYSGQSACEISCNAGDKYRITSNNFYQALRVVFMNDDTPIGGVWSAANRWLMIDTYFTIPTNCTSIIVQRGNSADKIILEKATTALKPMSSLTGKKICLIGDSITEWNSKANTNWAMWLAEWNTCEITNLGLGGTGFARGGDSRYINRISGIPSDTDIIGVAVSFNDMAEGLPIGNTTDTGTSSLCGYANDFFTALLNSKTSVPIIVYIQSPWGDYRPSVQASDDWVTMLSTICHNYGIPYYNELYYGGTLKPWRSANKATYYTPDDESTVDMTHPNSIGHKTIAKALQEHFVSNTI